MDIQAGWKLASYCSRMLPIFYAIIGFCTLIVIHEFGHFLFAKCFGIHTPTFSVGIGPKIIEKKIGTTNFRLSAFPLGGYCEIAGLAEPGQGEQQFAKITDERSFAAKSYWQKILVILGGVIFNFMFAYFAFISLFLIGKPLPKYMIRTVTQESLAEKTGLKPGDIIVEMGSSNIEEQPNLIAKEIGNLIKLEHQSYQFVIKRDDTLHTFNIELPALDAPKKKQSPGRLGIIFDQKPSERREYLPILQAIPTGIKLTNQWIYFTLLAIKNLFVQRTLKGAGGPLLIITESVNQARHGFAYLLIFLAIISINLAILNLFPIPALDGGQLIFISIESFLGRPIPIGIKNTIYIGSWIFILSLILLFTYNDIKYLLGK